MIETLKIGLVDDQELVRKGFKMVINSFRDIEVNLEAKSGNDLLNQLEQRRVLPDILLLDLSMDDMDGVDTAKELMKKYPGIKVAVLSLHYTPTLVKLMTSLNACAYFKKNTSPKELEKGLRAIGERGRYFTEELYELIRTSHIAHNSPKADFTNPDLLTERERQVLELICLEKNSKEISSILRIGLRTVETHRKNLILKTKSKNIAGLVIYAISHDLIDPKEMDEGNKKLF